MTLGKDPTIAAYEFALQLAKDGHFPAARDRLRAVLVDPSPLSSEQRMRAYGCLGNCLQVLGESDHALWHLKAYQAAPETTKGMLYGVIGYINAANHLRAEQVLNELSTRFPDSEEGWAARLKLCNTKETLLDAIRLLPAHLKEADEIVFSCIMGLARFEFFDEALTYLDKVRTQGEETIITRHTLVSAIVEKYRSDPFARPNTSELEVGITLSDQVLSSQIIKHSTWLLTATHVLRSFLYEFLGKDDLALDAIQRAIAADPSSPHPRNRKALFRTHQIGYLDAIVETKREMVRWKESPDVCAVLGRLEYLGKSGDWAARIEEYFSGHLTWVAEQGCEYSHPLFTIIMARVARNDVVGASQLIDQHIRANTSQPQEWVPFYDLIHSDLANGRTAANPFQQMSEKHFRESPILIQSMADYCKLTGRLLASFNQLVTFALAVRPEYAEREISELSLQIDDPLAVAERLRLLRQTKGERPVLINIEAAVLFKAGQQISAINLVESFLHQHPAELTRYRAIVGNYCQFCILAHEKGRVSAAHLDVIARSPGESPEDVVITITTLREFKRPNEAAAIGYAAVRKYRDNPRILMAYAGCFVPTIIIELPHATVITPDCAFGYRRQDDTREIIGIMEDDSPSVSLHEISSKSPIGLAAMGRSEGQIFIVSEVNYTVIWVRDKRLYRAKEIIVTWEERYPDIFFVKRIRLTDPSGTTLDPTALLKITDGDYAHEEHLIETYRTHRVPMHMVARALGRPLPAAIQFVTRHAQWLVASGSDEEWNAGIAAWTSMPQALVLERTTFWSLILTDAYPLVMLSKIPLYVDENTLVEARAVVAELMEAAHHSYLQPAARGRINVFERDPIQVEDLRRRIVNAIEFHQSAGLVLDPIAGTGALTEADKKFITEQLGPSTLSAAIYAKQHGYRLVVDDRITRDVLASKGIACSWAQSWIFALEGKAIIPLNSYALYVGRCCAAGLYHVMIRHVDARRCLALGNYDIENPAIAAVLRAISDRSTMAQQQAGIMSILIVDVWRHAALEESAVSGATRMIKLIEFNPWVPVFLQWMAAENERLIPIDIRRQAAFRAFVISQCQPVPAPNRKKRRRG